jgi:hypothetical protein
MRRLLTRLSNLDCSIVPHHVYWDQGSARLLNALGVTSATTSDNVGWRQHLVSAYCDALEAPETEDVEPGL